MKSSSTMRTFSIGSGSPRAPCFERHAAHEPANFVYRIVYAVATYFAFWTMKPPVRTQERGVARLLRQQASLAPFGSFAFREPMLLLVLNEAARICAECLGVPYSKICRY